MSFLQKIRKWARVIKRDAVTLWFAYKNPKTPIFAKCLCVLVVAYALSPFDLIPDFVPILGYVDDVLLLPALIWLSLRLVPDDILADCRILSDEWLAREGRKPRSYLGGLLVILVWIAMAWIIWIWVVEPKYNFS